MDTDVVAWRAHGHHTTCLSRGLTCKGVISKLPHIYPSVLWFIIACKRKLALRCEQKDIYSCIFRLHTFLRVATSNVHFLPKHDWSPELISWWFETNTTFCGKNLTFYKYLFDAFHTFRCFLFWVLICECHFCFDELQLLLIILF